MEETVLDSLFTANFSLQSLESEAFDSKVSSLQSSGSCQDRRGLMQCVERTFCIPYASYRMRVVSTMQNLTELCAHFGSPFGRLPNSSKPNDCADFHWKTPGILILQKRSARRAHAVQTDGNRSNGERSNGERSNSLL